MRIFPILIGLFEMQWYMYDLAYCRNKNYNHLQILESQYANYS